MTLEDDRTKKDIRNSTWHLLAEISLTSESDEDGDETILAAKSLSEAIRESGLPPINVHRAEKMFTEIRRKGRNQSSPGGISLPLTIRVFSQLGNALTPSDNTDREILKGTKKPHELASDIMPPGQISSLTGDHNHLGWGHFMVERIVDNPSLPTESPYTLIEIFFYREVKAS
jgi:hypothetical protein